MRRTGVPPVLHRREGNGWWHSLIGQNHGLSIHRTGFNPRCHRGTGWLEILCSRQKGRAWIMHLHQVFEILSEGKGKKDRGRNLMRRPYRGSRVAGQSRLTVNQVHMVRWFESTLPHIRRTASSWSPYYIGLNAESGKLAESGRRQRLAKP